MTPSQLTDTVLMVAPAVFGSNPETLGDNGFQSAAAGEDPVAINTLARAEQAAVATALRAAGVRVLVEEDRPAPACPDAVFPNNWFSTHADGALVLYPMAAPSRRAERRADVVARLQGRFGWDRVVDLTSFEATGRALEGTGSLVLDRVARVAFVAWSPRSERGLAQTWAQALGYRVVGFTAALPGRGGEPRPVYHTNVVLSVGEGIAVGCLDAVADPGERARLAAELRSGGRALVELGAEQVAAFAGNVLQLATPGGGRLWALSERAWGALDAGQRAALERHGRPVPVAVPTIERLGGGSVRCMLAELFPPAGRGAGPYGLVP